MKSRAAPRRIEHEISTQPIGTEMLVYDGLRHRAFCLNRSSSVIWRLADGARTVEEIQAAAAMELKTAVSEDLVRFALEELRREGLLQAGEPVEARAGVSRRAVLQSLGAGGMLLLPAIASILAPTAAQAYSGCFDCSSPSAEQAARARRLQQQRGSSSSSPDSAPAGSPDQ
jgi:hypothetical protein